MIHRERSGSADLADIVQPVDEEELRILQSETISSSSPAWRRYPSTISMSVADDRLQNRSGAPEFDVQAALDRIKEYTAEDRDIMWDIIIKTFDDFDRAYFQGILRRCVLLQWKPFREEPGIFAVDPSLKNLGLTLQPNTPPNKHSRVRIYMRTDFKWDKLPKFYMLGCLLHEMLHAYFIVKCGGEGAREIGAEDPGHEPLFVRAAKWLEGRSGLDLLIVKKEVAEVSRSCS